jgi:hypothetical protein
MADEQPKMESADNQKPEVAGEQSHEYPKEVKLEELIGVKGLYTVLWRNRSKQTAKIIGTEKEGEFLRAIYEIMTDPDKGKVCSAKYDATQVVVVYDDDTLILAGLET